MKFRSEYYDRLDAVRLKGDYEGWIKYFLRAIRSCADDIVKRAWAIDLLLQNCNLAIQSKPAGVRKNAVILLEQLCHTPILTANDVMELLEANSYNTAQKLLNTFVDIGILVSDSDRERNKAYTFRKYLDILETGFLDI